MGLSSCQDVPATPILELFDLSEFCTWCSAHFRQYREAGSPLAFYLSGRLGPATGIMESQNESRISSGSEIFFDENKRVCGIKLTVYIFPQKLGS